MAKKVEKYVAHDFGQGEVSARVIEKYNDKGELTDRLIAPLTDNPRVTAEKGFLTSGGDKHDHQFGLNTDKPGEVKIEERPERWNWTQKKDKK